jgi:hypothetical protein
MRRTNRESRRSAIAALLAITVLPSTQAAEPSAIALVGRWTGSATHPTAGEVTITLSITQTMKFSGDAQVGGKPFWTYAGTIALEGRRLIWRYETSSIAMSDAMKTDIDEVISLDADELVVKSTLSGERRVLRRLR